LEKKRWEEGGKVRIPKLKKAEDFRKERRRVLAKKSDYRGGWGGEGGCGKSRRGK